MKIRKYLGPNRMFVWHSLHVIFVLILMISGFGMYFSNTGTSLFDFDARQSLHEIFGVLVTIIYFLFFIVFHLEANRFRLSYWWRSLLSKLLITKEKATKHEKYYNSVIISRYQIIMFLLFPLLIISGFAMLFPLYSSKNVFGIDFYFILLMMHFVFALLLTTFTVIHLFIVLINKKEAKWLHPFIRKWFKL